MFSSKIIGCGLLVILCLIGASVAQDELQDELQDMQFPLDDEDQESRMERVMGLLENVEALLDTSNETETDMDTDTDTEETELEDPDAANGLCKCHKRNCRCCRRVFVRGIFCRRVCFNLQYLWKCNAFLTTLRMGGRVYFSRVVDAKHPYPVCARLTVRKRQISFCIRMNHLKITRKCVTGCDAFVLRWSCAGNRCRRRRCRRFRGGCWRFRRCCGAEASFTRLPNNYYDRPANFMENLLSPPPPQQQQEEEEEMTPSPEFDDIEADVMEELSRSEKAGGAVTMDNAKN